MSSSRSVPQRTGRVLAAVTAGASCTPLALLLVACTLALSGCGTANSASLIDGFSDGYFKPLPEAPAVFDRSKLEPQSPPPMRMFARPDDPKEPYSPNYGSIPLDGPGFGSFPEPDNTETPPAATEDWLTTVS